MQKQYLASNGHIEYKQAPLHRPFVNRETKDRYKGFKKLELNAHQKKNKLENILTLQKSQGTLTHMIKPVQDKGIKDDLKNNDVLSKT